jgi:hypothetical protein
MHYQGSASYAFASLEHSTSVFLVMFFFIFFIRINYNNLAENNFIFSFNSNILMSDGNSSILNLREKAFYE